jgi:ubiquinone biosynthesis protein
MPIFRLFRITFETVRFGLGNAFAKIGLFRPRSRPPERLCLVFARLGPTFIKFGQALSVRRDLLPDDYIAALQSLQENVAPFAADVAIREIEHGLGSPIDQLFDRFDRAPLAAASIAQVHTARLKDGRDVIVKVRRVGIKQAIERDMRALALLTRLIMRLAPRLRHYQSLRILDEIRNNLRKETDFRQEARNIRRFAAAFADWPAIEIPGVVDELFSETVIVQERSGRRRIDDPAIAEDGPRLAQNFLDAYLHQIFVLGIFHGDPHPGNLFITGDGRICFHDFGLAGLLDRTSRRKLAAFTAAFMHQDAEWLLDAAIDLGVLGGEMDRSRFQRGLADIISDYAAMPIKEWSLAEAFLRVTRLGQAQNVLVPYDLLILMRAMFLAEEALRVLDPRFQLLENLQTKGPEVLKSAMAPSDWRGTLERLEYDAVTVMHGFPAALGALGRRLSQEGKGLGFTLRVRELDDLKQHLDRSSNRLALAMVTLGLYVSGSLLMQHSIGPRIFGEVPVLAAAAFALALWLTWRLVRGISRSGHL